MPTRTRGVPKERYANFSRKSDEFHQAGEDALKRGNWDATVSSAVHAAISISDALTVYHLGERSAARDHESSVKLLSALNVDPRELGRAKKHLSALLGLKGLAEYDDRLLGESEARAALDHCSRFRSWAKGKLP